MSQKKTKTRDRFQALGKKDVARTGRVGPQAGGVAMTKRGGPPTKASAKGFYQFRRECTRKEFRRNQGKKR